MVFIKTRRDDKALYLEVDTECTTLLGLKEEIGKHWIIPTLLQKLYLGLENNPDYKEIINLPSLQLRDDWCEGCNKLSIAELGVEPWSTLLLEGPVFRPRSFFESPACVLLTANPYSDWEVEKDEKPMTEQEYNLLMDSMKLKVA